MTNHIANARAWRWPTGREIVCGKCTGRGTRGHHRYCLERGLGQRGRRWRAWIIERLGEVVGVRLRVRRGSRGAGLSLPKAKQRAEFSQNLMAGTRADIEDRARIAGLGAGAKVTSEGPGCVVVTPSGRRPMWLLERAQRELQRHVAAWVRLRVVHVAYLPAVTVPAGVCVLDLSEIEPEITRCGRRGE